MTIIATFTNPKPDISIMEMDCTVAEEVGDLVRLDAVTANLAVKAVDNIVDRPVIGLVLSKLSTTRCKVAIRGILNVAIGNGRLYLSPTGVLSLTSPSTDYRQALGYSFGNGKIYLDPSPILTKNTL